ncbi:MAG: DDE-type integrase/transposase/recombinase [Nitrospinae bacterium]|nr:DDE-type integrase/transposase/recombinase [Nitrospinota bacterium]
MNKLSMGKQVQVISALVEGNSIRSIERMSGIHRDTIMRTLVRVGSHCQAIMDTHLRGFHSRFLQADEIWTFVAKKEGRLSQEEKGNTSIGDQYCFVAIDAETKLVPTFLVGKRNSETAFCFIKDLHQRLNGNGRIQLTTDGLRAYTEAVWEAFGGEIDYAQQVKFYASVNPGPGRYSPPRVAEVVSMRISGNPDERHISTSYVERQNLTMRMAIKRFARLTLAFSKKLENLNAALALHFAHYNFVRVHRTLRVTPAMAAGISDHVMGIEELIS